MSSTWRSRRPMSPFSLREAAYTKERRSCDLMSPPLKNTTLSKMDGFSSGIKSPSDVVSFWGVRKNPVFYLVLSDFRCFVFSSSAFSGDHWLRHLPSKHR